MNKYPNYMFIDFDSARGSYTPTHDAVSPRSPSPEVLEAIEAQIASQKAVSPNDEQSTAPLPGEAGSSLRLGGGFWQERFPVPLVHGIRCREYWTREVVV